MTACATSRSLRTWPLMAVALLAVLAGCGGDAAAVRCAGDGCGDGSTGAADAVDGSGLDAAGDATAVADGAQQIADDVTQGDATATGCAGGAGCPCSSDDDCDDGNPCTYGGACIDGSCNGGLPEPCDDGNACTSDFCEMAVGCTAVAAETWCSDGNPCTVGDSCSGATCQAGKAAVCDDGNSCTTDSCVAGQGCQYAHNQLECAPANDCVETSYCSYGHCIQGKAKPCSDGLACTLDDCDPKSGCSYWPLPAPADCADGQVVAGKCWKALKLDGTWAAARQACRDWGGELASIRSIADNQTARKLAEGACGQQPAWIGLSDVVQEGVFVWSDGEPSLYRLWNGGEPNNAGNEDVVELTPSGGWNDLPASAGRGCAVCARKPAYACDDGDACTAPSYCKGGGCASPSAVATCDDGNPCTLDGCAVDLGCGHTAVTDGAACGAGTCKAGACEMPQSAGILKACSGLAVGAPSALWWLDPDGAGPVPPFQAWCDNHSDGGGWTLVHRSDGGSAEAAFGAELWTSAVATAGASPLPAGKPARLPGYATLPLPGQAVRLVMRVGAHTGALVLPAPAGTPSLHALLNGKAVATQLDLQAWQGLLPKGSLQGNCLLQGFAIGSPSGVQARIGILGNNENDCSSVDSWLGVGATANICGIQGAPTGGNVACWYPDAGDAKTAAQAWLYVR